MGAFDRAMRDVERMDTVADDFDKRETDNPKRRWPSPMDPAAYHGLAGELVRIVEPHTESDPAAILSQFLVAAGNCIGRGPHYRVEGDQHHANLNVVTVGETAKGRKGTAWGRARQPFGLLDDPWAAERIMSGLSSGEGLIWQVRDPIHRIERDKKTKKPEEVLTDPGITDKRLMVLEAEFASTIRVLGREGNTLSALIRQAWDRGNLASMTKNTPAKATNAHVSIIGHITAEELRRYLNLTETANGFANRFLFICVRRSKCLPDGGALSEDDIRPIAKRLAFAMGDAKRVGRVTMDDEARKLWHEVYPELSDGLPGLLGAVTSRAEAQVVRLALVYALLNGDNHIRLPHLRAAIALWDYAEDSARYVFGEAFGDPVADEIMQALRTAGKDGMTRTEINNLFKRHQSAGRIGRALDMLRERQLASPQKVPTGGRPCETWVVTQ